MGCSEAGSLCPGAACRARPRSRQSTSLRTSCFSRDLRVDTLCVLPVVSPAKRFASASHPAGQFRQEKFFRRIVFFCHIPGMLCVNSNEGEAVKKILRTIYQSGSLLAGLLHLAGSLLAGLKSLNISAAPFRSSNNSRRVWLAPTFGQSCVSWVW